MFDTIYEAKPQARNQTDAIGNTYDLWRFKSEKSNKEYVVMMEKYHNNIYGVKFYLHSQRKDGNKFSKMTGDQEAPAIIRTVIDVMMRYVQEQSDSSFVIIGASGINEEVDKTKGSKRFQLYERVISQFVSEKHFVHASYPEHNVYLLIRRSEVNSGHINPNDCVEFIISN